MEQRFNEHGLKPYFQLHLGEEMKEKGLILLVEDDENDAYFIDRAFRELGFEGLINRLNNTDDAKIFLKDKEQVPELVIADSSVTMRDSGVEFLEWVRANQILPQTPFMILSGGVSDATRQRAEQAGVTEIVGKGCNYREMVSALRGALEKLPGEARGWLK